MKKLKVHKATSVKAVVTECGLYIDAHMIEARNVSLPWTTDWKNVTCGNCSRTRVQSSMVRGKGIARSFRSWLNTWAHTPWGGQR